MGFFSRLKGIFSGRGAAGASGSGKPSGGFWQRRKEKREEKRREREWKKSQERMEKMEKESLKQKAQRKAEEQKQKRASERKSREYHERGRETFKDRYGFNDKEYDGFVQFVDGMGEDLKEVFGSNNLVEAFRTGRSLGLSPADIKSILDQTYNMTEGGTQEDIINDLYSNMEAYAENVREGSYV